MSKIIFSLRLQEAKIRKAIAKATRAHGKRGYVRHPKHRRSGGEV